MADLTFRDIERLPVDFEEIVELLKHRVQLNLPNRWSDFLASNFGVELLEAVAYEAALMNYYVNANLNECFMPTAKTHSAVYGLAKTIGYKPKPPSQSTVTLKFYLEKPHTKNISIPLYTKVSTNSGIPFYTIENKTLYAGETYVEVMAKSGSLNDQDLLATGAIGTKYQLRNYPVNAIEYLTVNSEEYEYVDYIDSEGQNKQFTVSWDSNFTASISFGDGTYGMLPAKRSLISVKYVTGANKTHNVGPYQITNINDNIYDSTNTLINIMVTNPTPAVGADDAETLDEIKRNAPSLYRTQHRCVTLQDFKDTALAFPGVHKVSVMDQTKLDEIGIFGVKVAIIPDGGGYPSAAFKDLLKKHLETKKITATQVDVIDPTYIPFNVDVTIKVQPKISTAIVSNKIREVLHSYLSWTNREFGEEISKQEIYKRISNIAGVLSIENLSIYEKRVIYVKETPVVGSNQLRVFDGLNALNVGTRINVMNLDGSLALQTTILEIDGSTLTINDLITDSMNISQECLVYPVCIVNGLHQYGSKEILLVNNSTPIEGEARDYSLLNMSYLTVHFSDDTNKLYHVLFRNGDTVYLDSPIDRDIPDGTEMIVLYKNLIPSLSSTSTVGSSFLKLTSYPRFSTGSLLISSDIISFEDVTLAATRSSSGIDYLSDIMNTDDLSRVNAIYTNASNVFEENIDYTLSDHGKIIQWTNTGKLKLKANSKYFIDITKRVIDTSPSNIKYYVKHINKKLIEISPPLTTTLPEGSTLEYDSEIFSLLPYEIADLGNVTINIL